MSRLRLVGMALSLTLLGCGWSHPSFTAGAQPPRPAPLPQQPAPEPPATESGVRTTSFPRNDDNSNLLVGSTVIARVNGQPVLFEEVINAASWRLEEARQRVSPEQWTEAEREIIRTELEEIINRELLLQDATARVKGKAIEKVREAAQKDFDKQMRKQRDQLNLKTDEELKLYLEKQGKSIDEMRRQFERSYLAMEYIRSMVRGKMDAIDRAQLIEYYQENPKEFDKPERVTWQHLYIDVDRVLKPDAPREYAERLLAKVRAAMTDAEVLMLAQEFTHGPSRNRPNCEGEGTERGLIRPKELEDVLFRMQPGQVSDVIEIGSGLHIVRVLDHQPGGKVPFEKACPEIKKKLQGKIGQAEYQRLVKELRDKAYIESIVAK